MKKLYRAKEGKWLLGVCAGLSQYLNVDVNIIRIIAITLGFGGLSVIAYIAALIIVPEEA